MYCSGKAVQCNGRALHSEVEVKKRDETLWYGKAQFSDGLVMCRSVTCYV